MLIFLDVLWSTLLRYIQHWCINMLGLWVMVFNPTFNDILVTSLWSVLLVEETGVTGEDHRPDASHWQFLSHNVVSSTPRHDRNLNSPLALIPQVAVNPPTIRSQPHRPPKLKRNHINVQKSNISTLLLLLTYINKIQNTLLLNFSQIKLQSTTQTCYK